MASVSQKNEEWFVEGRDDTNKGPFTFADLQRLAKVGEVLPSTLVWKAGMPDWVAADQVEGVVAPTKKEKSVQKVISQTNSGASKLLEGVPIEKVSSRLNSVGFYRGAGIFFGLASMAIFLLSCVGYPFGMTWFGGSAMCATQFLLLQGIAAILRELKELSSK